MLSLEPATFSIAIRFSCNQYRNARLDEQYCARYLQQTGTLVESPPLFLAHVVQQANGNPQALADLLTDASKERVVNKARIREMKHAAGVRYLDFTSVMIVALASVVGARYLAIGTGDTELYIFAGMLAAVVISVRVFLFQGAGKDSLGFFAESEKNPTSL